MGTAQEEAHLADEEAAALGGEEHSEALVKFGSRSVSAKGPQPPTISYLLELDIVKSHTNAREWFANTAQGAPGR